MSLSASNPLGRDFPKLPGDLDPAREIGAVVPSGQLHQRGVSLRPNPLDDGAGALHHRGIDLWGGRIRHGVAREEVHQDHAARPRTGLTVPMRVSILNPLAFGGTMALSITRLDSCLSARGGRLFVEDCDAAELARRHGTPVYVISEDQLRRNIRRITEAFRTRWPDGPVHVLPSIKANYSLALRWILSQEGAGCDAFGGAELEDVPGIDAFSLFCRRQLSVRAET